MTCSQYQKKAHQINQQPVIHYRTCNQEPKPQECIQMQETSKGDTPYCIQDPSILLVCHHLLRTNKDVECSLQDLFVHHTHFDQHSN